MASSNSSLSDWLTNSTEKRILLVHSVRFGKAVLRGKVDTGANIGGVEILTPVMLAKNILLQKLSSCNATILSRDYAVALLRSMMLDKSQKGTFNYAPFNNPLLLDLDNCREIYDKLNLLRLISNRYVTSSGKSNSPASDDENRLNDLMKVRDEFETKLETENKYDDFRLLHEAVQEIAGNKPALPIAYIDNSFTDADPLLKKFLKSLNAQQFPLSLTDQLPEIKGFIKGYGIYNECCGIAASIIDNAQSFGDTAIYYPDDSYLTFLPAVFSAQGIAYRFISNHPDQGHPLFLALNAILEWAESDFEFAVLEKYWTVIKPGNSLKKFEIIKKAASNKEYTIGWGLERYKDYKDKNKLFLGELYDLFDDINVQNVNCSCLLAKLLELISFKSDEDKDYQSRWDKLSELKEYLGNFNYEYPLPEAITFLRTQLAALTFREKESGQAVSLIKNTGLKQLTRKHNYFCGLSALNMQASATESAILNDEQLRSLFGGEKWVPTTESKANKKRADLENTLKAANGKDIYFSYSSFDVSKMIDCHAASIYTENLCTATAAEKEYVYGEPIGSLQINKPQCSLSPSSPDIFNPADGKPTFTSPSRLEAFLKCPKQYAYNAIYKLKIDEAPEKEAAVWLNVSEKGTYVHSILEKYMSKRNDGEISLSDALNAAVMATNADYNVSSYSAVKYPEYISWTANAERETIKAKLEAFLTAIDEKAELSWSNDYTDGWHVLVCEYPLPDKWSADKYHIDASFGKNNQFDTQPAKTDFANSNNTYKSKIDRIDFMIDATDSEKAKVHLRLIDYKTGKKEPKEKDGGQGVLLQLDAYKAAVKADPADLLQKIADKTQKDISALEIDNDIKCCYCFPLSDESRQPVMLDYKDDYLQSASERLEVAKQYIIDNKYYPKTTDISDYRKPCDYCKYKNILCLQEDEVSDDE